MADSGNRLRDPPLQDAPDLSEYSIRYDISTQLLAPMFEAIPNSVALIHFLVHSLKERKKESRNCLASRFSSQFSL